eukprot:656157-Prorocentrum_minimum.AAC.1
MGPPALHYYPILQESRVHLSPRRQYQVTLQGTNLLRAPGTLSESRHRGSAVAWLDPTALADRFLQFDARMLASELHAGMSERTVRLNEAVAGLVRAPCGG